MPLASPAVSELEIEGSVLRLFNEFLKSFFDGANHAVGNNSPVAFPNVEMRFQQSAVSQPLNGVAISVVWIKPSNTKLFWDNVGNPPVRQQTAKAMASLLFIVRAQGPETGTGNPRLKAQQTADLLFAVLQNSHATKPLAQKGIHKLRPENPQLAAADSPGSKPGDTAYAMRALACGMTIRYPVLSQVL